MTEELSGSRVSLPLSLFLEKKDFPPEDCLAFGSDAPPENMDEAGPVDYGEPCGEQWPDLGIAQVECEHSGKCAECARNFMSVRLARLWPSRHARDGERWGDC